jgi:hypothetical protein
MLFDPRGSCPAVCVRRSDIRGGTLTTTTLKYPTVLRNMEAPIVYKYQLQLGLISQLRVIVIVCRKVRNHARMCFHAGSESKQVDPLCLSVLSFEGRLGEYGDQRSYISRPSQEHRNRHFSSVVVCIRPIERDGRFFGKGSRRLP